MIQELLPPHDTAAEEAVIGSVFIDPTALDAVSKFLRPEHFYTERNRWIFEAMQQLNSRRELVNQVTIARELFEQQRLEDSGGNAYLAHTVMITPTSVHALAYARSVRNAAIARQFGSLVNDRASEAYLEPSRVVDIVSKAAVDVANIITEEVKDSDWTARRMFDVVMQDMSEMTNPLGRIETGFRHLDGLLSGGMTPEELIIIGGRPGDGKSVISMQIGANALRAGKRVMAFTIEMDAKRVARRLISARVGMPTGVLDDSIRHDSAEAPAIIDAIGELSDWSDRLILNDSAAPTIEYIQGRILAEIAARRKPDLVIVDHIQLVGTNETDRGASRNQQLDDITRALKGMAREHKLVVIATSQFNRTVVNRNSKVPSLSDLRDSGTIEQNSDVVLLLHHPDSKASKDNDVKVRVIVAKNRGGALGDVGLMFQKPFSRFREL